MEVGSPTWFTEGIAEMLTFELTGRRSGYSGAKGLIGLDRRVNSVVDMPEYVRQSSLGADFLIEVYKLLGRDAASAFARDVAHHNVTGPDILNAIRRQTPADARDGLEALIKARFV